MNIGESSGNIIEFYGSTEGNIALFNGTGTSGALGWIPRIFDFFYPVCILKIQKQNDCGTKATENGNSDAVIRPWRHPVTGLCELSAPGEIGLVVGAVDASRSDRRFDGYKGNPNATNNKIIKDVFAIGDSYFDTGDLMSRDEEGYFRWADRTGDTFRWKGENISTVEVEAVLASLPAVKEVCVYGVNIPGADGRAGMAAVVLHPSAAESKNSLHDDQHVMLSNTSAHDLSTHSILWKQLRDVCVANLQKPARPVFLRVMEALPLTATFKHIKTDLVRDAFDPIRCLGEVWVWVPDRALAGRMTRGRSGSSTEAEAGCYKRVDPELYQDIVTGKWQL